MCASRKMGRFCTDYLFAHFLRRKNKTTTTTKMRKKNCADACADKIQITKTKRGCLASANDNRLSVISAVAICLVTVEASVTLTSAG